MGLATAVLLCLVYRIVELSTRDGLTSSSPAKRGLIKCVALAVVVVLDPFKGTRSFSDDQGAVLHNSRLVKITTRHTTTLNCSATHAQASTRTPFQADSILNTYHPPCAQQPLRRAVHHHPASRVRLADAPRALELQRLQAAQRSITPNNTTPVRQPTDIMAHYFQDLAYLLSNCMSCFPGSPKLKINNRSFKILRLLGEVRKTIFKPGL